MVKGEGKCFAQIKMPDQRQECGCNFSFSVPSLAMILGFFLGHDRLKRQCEDEDLSPSTRIVPHPFLQASVHTATPPLPSAVSLTMSFHG